VKQELYRYYGGMVELMARQSKSRRCSSRVLRAMLVTEGSRWRSMDMRGDEASG